MDARAAKADGWLRARVYDDSAHLARKRLLTRSSTHLPGQRPGYGSAGGRGVTRQGDVLAVFDRDFLCTTASIYWLTRSIGTSIRLYRDHYSHGWKPHHDRSPIVEAPTGFGVYPKDVVFVPRSLAERATNLVRWTVMPRGGHFGPAEQPRHGQGVDDILPFAAGRAHEAERDAGRTLRVRRAMHTERYGRCLQVNGWG